MGYMGSGIGETSWERPGTEDNGLLQTEENKASIKPTKIESSNTPVLQNSESIWVELFDEATKRPYFHNKTTGESKWDRPGLVRITSTEMSARATGITSFSPATIELLKKR